jgi:hypothetical protein
VTYTYRGVTLPILMVLLPQIVLISMIDFTPFKIGVGIFTMTLLLVTFFYYELHITANKITYTVKLFKFKIKTVELTYEDIYCVWFKRAGWARKKALIKRKKGFAIHMLSEQPHHLFNHLTDFCASQDIAIHKTSDYELLERMSAPK